MRVRGMASDETLDLDDEVLTRSGFGASLAYLQQWGKFNDDHAKTLLGDVDTALIAKKGELVKRGMISPKAVKKGQEDQVTLYVAGNFNPMVPEAVERYRYLQGGGKLGLSVQGAVLHSKPIKANGKSIKVHTRCFIPQVAVTPQPKNVNSWVEIARSFAAVDDPEGDVLLQKSLTAEVQKAIQRNKAEIQQWRQQPGVPDLIGLAQYEKSQVLTKSCVVHHWQHPSPETMVQQLRTRLVTKGLRAEVYGNTVGSIDADGMQVIHVIKALTIGYGTEHAAFTGGRALVRECLQGDRVAGTGFGGDSEAKKKKKKKKKDDQEEAQGGKETPLSKASLAARKKRAQQGFQQLHDHLKDVHQASPRGLARQPGAHSVEGYHKWHHGSGMSDEAFGEHHGSVIRPPSRRQLGKATGRSRANRAFLARLQGKPSSGKTPKDLYNVETFRADGQHGLTYGVSATSPEDATARAKQDLGHSRLGQARRVGVPHPRGGFKKMGKAKFHAAPHPVTSAHLTGWIREKTGASHGDAKNVAQELLTMGSENHHLTHLPALSGGAKLKRSDVHMAILRAQQAAKSLAEPIGLDDEVEKAGIAMPRGPLTSVLARVTRKTQGYHQGLGSGKHKEKLATVGHHRRMARNFATQLQADPHDSETQESLAWHTAAAAHMRRQRKGLGEPITNERKLIAGRIRRVKKKLGIGKFRKAGTSVPVGAIT